MQLLEGTRVVDAAGEPASMAGRILADLGATVTKVGDPDEDPWRRRAWDHGCTRADRATDDLLEPADIVIETPGWPGCPVLDPARAPMAVWVSVTPFGLTGPHAGWRSTDLGVMAASGNMHATGDPDREPVRPSEPAAYAHAGPEIALAALTGLASGHRPLRVDVSMQELVCVANVCAPARFAATGQGFERRGANIGRSREIWPCRDGWVSFGLRGGKARVPSLQMITKLCEEAGVGTPALTERDWTEYSHTEVSHEELRAIEEPVAAFFAGKTMQELYEIACDTNLMLAPINSPKEIYASAQLAARDFFDEDSGLPRTFVHVSSAPTSSVSADGPFPARQHSHSGGAWEGAKIVEFGSGAAGPISTRYFTEHGATVVRVESKSRPDFLRVYALGPDNPHGLEGSHLFDGLNAGKLSVTLNLKHPDGLAVAKRLVGWADAVVENFAPKAMPGFGLDDTALFEANPNLVVVHSCLNGQTGPHKDYPGFGGQGAALSGWNFVTGWPDREPVGPFGTITDSLAPRFVATALAAGLHHQRRTGTGVALDLAQVECGIYGLSPWLLRWKEGGELRQRMGNRHPQAWLHGAFPCAGDDRWVAIACWNDRQRAALAEAIGDAVLPDDVVEAEAVVAAWTASRDRYEIAEILQAVGVEAVPVQDFADLLDDPQLAHRGHFEWQEHPVMGRQPYERNGLRLEHGTGGYPAPGPTLGQHTEHVLGDLLGLGPEEIADLEGAGALE